MHTLTGGGAILVSLSPQLAAACTGVFAFLWVVTVIYGAYSRHSQRVIQVWGVTSVCMRDTINQTETPAEAGVQ